MPAKKEPLKPAEQPLAQTAVAFQRITLIVANAECRCLTTKKPMNCTCKGQPSGMDTNSNEDFPRLTPFGSRAALDGAGMVAFLRPTRIKSDPAMFASRSSLRVRNENGT